MMVRIVLQPHDRLTNLLVLFIKAACEFVLFGFNLTRC